MNGEKRVLIACGTAIATATVVAEKVKEIAKETGVRVTVVQCKAAEVKGKMTTFNPDFIVATTPLPKDIGVPVLSGVPFLSGLQMNELKAQLVEALKSQ